VLCHTSQFVITANISFIVVSPIGSGIAHDFRNLLAIIDAGLRSTKNNSE
jgi:hypothetical protein